MNWTTEYPAKPGFYWIRNYRHYGKGHDGPVVVEVVQEECTFSGDPDLRFYFSGDEMLYRLTSLDSAEWQGPIEPDERCIPLLMEQNRSTFKRALPDMACAACAKIGTEYVSWPTREIDGRQYYSLICRPCWIERLTPEQRKVYMV